MDVAVVVILVSLWAAILLPGLVRARRYGSPASTVSRFHGSMDLLERTSVGKTKATRVAPANGRPAVPSPDAAPPRGTRSTADEWGDDRRHPSTGVPPSAARARRRAVLMALAGLLAAALVSIPLVGVAGWVLAGAVTVLLAGYVVTLRRIAVRRQLDRRVGDLASARAARRPGGGTDPPADQAAAAIGAGHPPPVSGVPVDHTPPQR